MLNDTLENWIQFSFTAVDIVLQLTSLTNCGNNISREYSKPESSGVPYMGAENWVLFGGGS